MSQVGVHTIEGFLAQTSASSTQKVFIFITNNVFIGSKYPKKHLIYFWKKVCW